MQNERSHSEENREAVQDCVVGAQRLPFFFEDFLPAAPLFPAAPADALPCEIFVFSLCFGMSAATFAYSTLPDNQEQDRPYADRATDTTSERAPNAMAPRGQTRGIAGRVALTAWNVRSKRLATAIEQAYPDPSSHPIIPAICLVQL